VDIPPTLCTKNYNSTPKIIIPCELHTDAPFPEAPILTHNDLFFLLKKLNNTLAPLSIYLHLKYYSQASQQSCHNKIYSSHNTDPLHIHYSLRNML